MAAWSSEEDALIRKYAKTHSATQIAAMLPGRSRASVTGRAWRLGESLAKDAATRRELEHPGLVRGKARRPAGPPRLAPSSPSAWPSASLDARRAALAVEPRLVPLEALGPFDCRWPFGEGELRFCGRGASSGPYCPAHRGIAYVPDPGAFDPEALAAVIERRDRRAPRPADAA